MATTKRVYILATFLLSGIAAIISLVSLGTEEWVTGTGVWTNLTVPEKNYINYGLFQGTFSQYTARRMNYQITMTCAFDLNVCALLCGSNSDVRTSLLRDLYNDNIDANYDMDGCPRTGANMLYDIAIPKTRTEATGSDKHFINSGIWLSTIIFLILSALMGFVASGLSLWNAVYNPIEIYFSIPGLYIYNAIAVCCTSFYIALWGSMHATTMLYDAGIYFTLSGKMSSDKTMHLGYSYWITFIPLVLYSCSIALLYTRQYLISKDPGQKNVHLDDGADPGLYLY